MIPFNKPYLTGKETEYIEQAVRSGKISGNGMFTQRCQQYFENRYGFKKCLLTTSCTDALEMAAILCDIQPGDEVIIPSYTFVSLHWHLFVRAQKSCLPTAWPITPISMPIKLKRSSHPAPKSSYPYIMPVWPAIWIKLCSWQLSIICWWWKMLHRR